MRAVANCCWIVLLLASTAVAQVAPPKATDKAAEGDGFEGLIQIGIAVVDAQLDHLAKPETAAKMAALNKTYYDAFVAQGFTKSQALVLTPGIAHSPTPGPGQEQLYNYLGKPETAKKVTALYKNYFDALVKQGFTPEEAFGFLRSVKAPFAEQGVSK